MELVLYWATFDTVEGCEREYERPGCCGCYLPSRTRKSGEVLVHVPSGRARDIARTRGTLTNRWRKRVFGCVMATSIEECVQHQKLRWLGHVLSMPNHRWPKRALFSMPNPEWRKQIIAQPLT
ncbi:hypothetical protein T265_07554 [Opisthorchis viverrini]|uniref:Uncharacterized protein n=1 Tax=Opisthorchis viverrini TaxID=6198 RepID=A0A074ZNG6_OPIVI|nr:hypothetical protein T265_07554 [Opisthorchis viverrini]KER24880.1 hypothetical protein T265_07554 [Opisthorchis viverrini]